MTEAPAAVLSHGPITPLEENLWMVDGALPGMTLHRTMVLARLSDGRLVVHNGIALDADGARALEALGEPAFLLVPNGYHRIDAARYKARYPRIRVLCPKGATARVRQVVAVDGDYDDAALPGGGPLRLAHLDGTREREGVLSVRSAAGTTLVFNDVLFNQPHLPGVSGFLLRVAGSTGGPRVTAMARLALVANKRDLAAHLRRLVEQSRPLRRAIPGHGLPIEDAPDAVLLAVAGSLAP